MQEDQREAEDPPCFRAAPVPVSTTECDVKTLERETRASIWTTDMRQLPLFNFAALYAYFITLTKKFKHIELASTSYKKLKAYQYFAEGNVKGIQVAKKHGTTYVKAKVLPSMKKAKYCTIIGFNNGQVTKAACDCPAGTCPGGLGKCNHIGGLLFAIEAFNKTELRDNPTPVSSTSRLSVWNVPRNDKVNAQEITNVKLGRIRYGKETKYMKTNHYDPRALHHRTVDQNALDMFRRKIGAMCPDSMFLLYGANRDTSSNSSPSHNAQVNGSPDTQHNMQANGSPDPPHNTQANGSPDPQHNTQANGSPDTQHNTQANGSPDPPHNTQANGSPDPQHNTQANGSPDTQHNTQANGSPDPPHNTQANGSPDTPHNTQANGSPDTQHNTQANGSPDPQHNTQAFDLPCNDLYDFSTSAFSDMMGTYVKSMKLSKDEQLTIEQETRGQGSSETWKEKRKEKLTSSNFGSAITCKAEPSNKVTGMLYSSFTT
ncbi:hypothetical protein Bbelb_361460 [Branchiostoma belcheri]|nr:hypothetical protein Bbelb_361460 [Branchiostoma belcheri]